MNPIPLAPDGTFAGYASLFDVPDHGGDIVARGAFTDSLARLGPSAIRMLFQHDPKEPVGIWTRIVEDNKGLYVEGRLALGNSRSRDLDALIQAGAIDGLSIGFKTITSRKVPGSNLRRLTRVDLWEVSIVTFPMLSGARIKRNASSTYPRSSGKPHTGSGAAGHHPSRNPIEELTATIVAATRR